MTPLERYRAQARDLILRQREDLAEPIVRQILALAPDDAVATRQLAICLRALRRLDEALEVARRAVSLDPNAAASYVTLGNVHSSRYEHEKSIPFFEEALQRNPETVAAFIGLANAGNVLGRWRAVLTWTDKGLRLRPDNCLLLNKRCTALAAMGREQEALGVLTELLRLAPADPSAHSAASTVYLRLKRYDEASAHTRKALSLQPANPEHHKVLGHILSKQGKLDEAEQAFQAALSLHPGLGPAEAGIKNVRIRRLMAEAATHIEKRNVELAVSPLRQVVELDPCHPIAQSKLALVLLDLSSHEEGLELARGAVHVKPQNAYARNAYAAALIHVGKNDQALAEVHEAIRLKPKLAGYWRTLASIHLDEERYPQAMEALEQGLAVDAHHKPLLRMQAPILAGLGRVDEAIAAVKSLIDGDDQDIWSHSCAGYAFRLLGQFENAERHCRRALELDKRGRAGRYGLGLALFEQRRYAEAKPHLEESLRNNPFDRRPRKALDEILTAEASDNAAVVPSQPTAGS